MNLYARSCATLVSAAALAVMVTGCTDSATASFVPSPTTLPPAEHVTPKTPALSDDDLFLVVIADEFPDAGQVHIDIAQVVCEAFGDGLSERQVVSIMLAELDWTPEQVGSVAGAAVGVYCPEHKGSAA